MNDFGFVILCPDRNYGNLRGTIRSIKTNFPDKPYLCVVVDDVSKTELKEFNSLCPTYKGGATYTSLINLGIKKNKEDWSVLFMAGFHIRRGFFRKYQYFGKSKKDILYPVIDRKWSFDEANINGLMFHKEAIKEVGEFDEDEKSFTLIKLKWGYEAINKGYQFKALVGVPR